MGMLAPPSDRVYIEALGKLLPTKRPDRKALRGRIAGYEAVYEAAPKIRRRRTYALAIFYANGYSIGPRKGPR